MAHASCLAKNLASLKIRTLRCTECANLNTDEESSQTVDD